jgi:hypothetical protein
MRLSISRGLRHRLGLLVLGAHVLVSAQAARRWRHRLGIDRYRVRCQPTHPMQVTGPDGLPQAMRPAILSNKKEFAGMKEVTAYNLKTKKQVKMLNPELVTLKNGRKALRGVAADDSKTAVVKMLSAEAIAEWEKA